MMMCAAALVLATSSSSESERRHYFPDSQLVLEMATLSHAVYLLRNKVTSCRDDKNIQNNNKNNNNSSSSSDSPGDRKNSTQTHDDDDDENDLFQRLLPVGTKCLYYSHDYSIGTQVLVVRSNLHNYVVVAYAGTDDWRTALTDGDVLMSDFGPRIMDDHPENNNTNNTSGTWDNNTNDDIRSIFENNVPDGIRVHRGFNEAVFNSNDFLKLLKCVASARLGGACCHDGDDGGCPGNEKKSLYSNRSVSYQLLTTGHSLGAADATLLGAALHLAYPHEKIRSVNFGGPKIGNIAWSFWINSLQPDKKDWERDSISTSSSSSGSYEIFRFVNKIDLVPRLPEILPPLTHAGHTLQMSVGGGIKVSVCNPLKWTLCM
jgi:hypothetical protein